jgi:hypothetical protein
VSRKPGGKKKDHGQLCHLGGLKSHQPNSDPAARTIDSHPDMRHVTERQHDYCEHKPKPPGSLPKVVVDKRRQSAEKKTNPNPSRLPLYEKIDVSMTGARKRARAEKHHDADDEQA